MSFILLGYKGEVAMGGKGEGKDERLGVTKGRAARIYANQKCVD